MPTNVRHQTVIRLIVKGQFDAQALIWQSHWAVSDLVSPGPYTVEDFLTAFRARYRAEILTKVSNRYRVLEYQGNVLGGRPAGQPHPPTAPPYDSQSVVIGDAALDVGQSVMDGLPSFNTQTVRVKTATPGRRYRGSFHLPPPLENATTSNEITAGDLAFLQTSVNTLMAPITSAVPPAGRWQIENGVFSRLSYMQLAIAQEADPFEFFRLATSWPVNRFIGSQTSRKQTARLL